MTLASNPSDVRAVLAAHRVEIDQSLNRHAASNPRLFGSYARGEASDYSDVDILVDLLPDGGNPLMRLAGLNEEISRIIGRDVDVVAAELLREPVAKSALADAIPL
jgi:predicted nucleotidyltransferase